jgi:peroxiredoxin
MEKPRSLKEKMDAVRAASAPETTARYDRMVAELRRVGAADGALKAGDAAPEFVLASAEGRLVSSETLLAAGPVVLSFYRGRWCPYCVTELEALEEAAAEIASLGASLLAVTGETGGGALSAKRDKGLSYEILTDPDNGLSLAYGLVFRLNDEVNGRYQQIGIDFPAIYGNASRFLPIPGTFVIDQKGIIRHAYVNPDFRERMDPAEIVTVLKALRAGP